MFTYTTEYNSKIERNEVLIYVTTWMNLSERIQIQKPSYSVTHLFKISRTGKIYRDRKQWLPRARGKWGVKEGRASFGGDEMFPN